MARKKRKLKAKEKLLSAAELSRAVNEMDKQVSDGARACADREEELQLRKINTVPDKIITDMRTVVGECRTWAGMDHGHAHLRRQVQAIAEAVAKLAQEKRATHIEPLHSNPNTIYGGHVGG